ncbi:MAG: hypothetical protein FWD92_03630 [Methanomassiliicoccaceae archaeon]|nr:hypothetical protein [Methanomassiliicoccaceae archaeon]
MDASFLRAETTKNDKMKKHAAQMVQLRYFKYRSDFRCNAQTNAGIDFRKRKEYCHEQQYCIMSIKDRTISALRGPEISEKQNAALSIMVAAMLSPLALMTFFDFNTEGYEIGHKILFLIVASFQILFILSALLSIKKMKKHDTDQ